MEKFILKLVILLSLVDLNAQSQIGCTVYGSYPQYEFGASVSLSSNGNRMAIGSWKDTNAGGSSAGKTQLYEWDGTDWNQLGNSILGEASFDFSGLGISLSPTGNRLAVGAFGNDDIAPGAGNTRIYEWNGNSLNQLGSDIYGEATNDGSGIAVSLSNNGDRIAIGAFRNNGNIGHVRIHEWDGISWNQVGVDINGEAVGDESGSSVSLSSDGTHVAIGARLNDGNGIDAGHVRIYEWNGISWNQIGVDINGEAVGDESGSSVSLSSDGTRVAIGARLNDGNGIDAGHVRIYEWNGVTWNQVGSDVDGEAAGDFSGASRSTSLSADGSRISVGASGNDGNGIDAGHVRIYEWNGVNWDQVETDIDGSVAGNKSGSASSISGDGNRIGIGSPGNRLVRVFGSSIPGAALHFYGDVNNYDYISIPDNNTLDFTNGFTFETWVKFNQVSRTTHSYDWQDFFAKPTYGGAYGLMLLTEGDKFLRFYHPGLSASSTSYAWTSVAANIWYHIAVTYDGSFVRMYIDGLEVNASTRTGNLDTNADPLHLGVSNGGASPPYPLDGTLDEIRFWNRALGISEIQQHKDCELTGTENGLAAYYQTNQGIANGINSSVSTLLDLTSNHNDGVLNNFESYGCASNWVSSGGVISGSACAPLPVELIKFIAIQINEEVKLKWITASEINNLSFEIQKSKNGRDWQILDFIHGNGTSSLLNEYEYIDSNPFLEINYYRLKQIDFDGVFEYSKVISVTVKKENEIEIYPNPTNGRLEIVGVEMAEIKIIDSFGRVVKELILSNGNIDISELSEGLYFISVKTEKGVITKRIIKE